MSRLSLFNSPLLLGFDHFERALDRVSKISADGYPPYNIEQLSEQSLRITLAVAGFAMSDLAITVEDSQLVVRGKQVDDGERVYLHRGIAARQFQRSFVLAEGIEVGSAWIDNGLLHIDLLRPEIESRVRTIAIQNGPSADGKARNGQSANGQPANGQSASGKAQNAKTASDPLPNTDGAATGRVLPVTRERAQP